MSQKHIDYIDKSYQRYCSLLNKGVTEEELLSFLEQVAETAVATLTIVETQLFEELWDSWITKFKEVSEFKQILNFAWQRHLGYYQ